MENLIVLPKNEMILVNGGYVMPYAGRAYKRFFDGFWAGLKEGVEAVVGAHYSTYH